MSYTIVINEEQRAGIVEALSLWLENGPDDEMSILRSLLCDLPKHETEHPNCTHGLCL